MLQGMGKGGFSGMGALSLPLMCLGMLRPTVILVPVEARVGKSHIQPVPVTARAVMMVSHRGMHGMSTPEQKTIFLPLHAPAPRIP